MQELNKKLIKKSGIYTIFNLENGNRYVGSTNNLYCRLYQHIKELQDNKHMNSHLQNAWNKYGKDCFEYGILEYCLEDIRLDREKYYIDLLNPEYNLNGVNTDSILNHSNETRKKISESIKESYKSGKLKKRIEESYQNSYDCYVYSIIDWKLVKHCATLAEASVLMGQNRFDLRLDYIGSRIFGKQYVVFRELIEDPIRLKNRVCSTVFKYISRNLKEDKYLICEMNNQRYYFRTIQSLVDFIGCSSKSTLSKHTDATRNNPYIIKNTNIKIYWSSIFIPYKQAVSIEKSSKLSLGNIGGNPEEDNTEISTETKESVPSYSVDSEPLN